MALTIIDKPNQVIESAYDQIVYGLQSNRDINLSNAVTGVTSTSFKATFTIGLHAYSAGDTVLMSGFSESTYNGTFDVIDITASSVICDLTFAGDDTGLCTLQNDNFAVSSQSGILGVNITYGISGVDTPTPPAVGVNLTRFLRTNIPFDDVVDGDLVNIITSSNSTLVRVWEVLGVTLDSGDTMIEIRINTTDTVGAATGSIEVIGSISGGYPEKFSNGIIIGSNERYRFNLSNMLQTLISGDLAALGLANIQNAVDGIIEIGTVYTEWHDNDEGIREDYETTSSTGVEYVDNIFQHTDTNTIDDYFLDTPTTGLFLTNAPDSQNIQVGEEVQLSFLTPNETDILVRYETFDLAGASNGVFSLGAVVVTSNKAIAPINSNIISSAISRADVWIARNSDNAQISEIKTFNVVSNCKSTRIWFSNSRGGYDAYSFKGNLEDVYNYKYNTINKSLPFGFSVQDRGRSVATSDNGHEFNLFSDFVRKEELTWFIDLYDSNDVYVIEDGILVPITLEKDKNLVESVDMVAINIEYKYANQQKTKIG